MKCIHLLYGNAQRSLPQVMVFALMILISFYSFHEQCYCAHLHGLAFRVLGYSSLIGFFPCIAITIDPYTGLSKVKSLIVIHGLHLAATKKVQETLKKCCSKQWAKADQGHCTVCIV